MLIDLNIPTRGRPERLFKTVSTAFATASDPSRVTVYLRFDHDDETINTSMEKLATLGNVNIRADTGDRLEMMSDLWNDLYRCGEGDILWHGNDDMYFASDNWDGQVRAEFAKWSDGIGMVWGNDGYQGDRLAVCSFTSRKAADILGTWLPPYFKSAYNDTWLTEVYQRLGRATYLPGMTIPHEHWSISNDLKHLHDETYAYRAVRTAGATVEYQHRAHQRLEWVAKLKEHLA